MLDGIMIVGEIAFILFYVFAIAFTIVDNKMGSTISAKLQKERWPTVVILIWAAIALVGVCIAIFRHCIP